MKAGRAQGVAGRIAVRAIHLFFLAVVSLVAVGADEGEAPVILLDRAMGETRLLSWFDLSDPEMVEPVDLMQLEPADAFRVIGLYNGMLFGRDADERLVGIDVRTGARFIASTPLVKSWVQEGGRIYELLGEGQTGGVRTTDLRARAVREYVLSDLVDDTGWKPVGRSRTGLQRFFQGTPEILESDSVVPGRLLDLQRPDAEPLTFDIILPAPSWRIDTNGWSVGSEDVIMLVPDHGARMPVSSAWLGDGRFAFVAVGVVLDGVRYPAESAPGPWHLFVLEPEARAVTQLSLASREVPATGEESALWTINGHGGAAYRFDPSTHLLVAGDRPTGGPPRPLGEHFTTRRVEGGQEIAHGNEPLKIGRDEMPRRYALDASETRVLLWGKDAVWYDIYCGYGTQVTPVSFCDFVARADFAYEESGLPAGWMPLLDQMGAAESLPVSGVLPGALATGRKSRAANYALDVSSDQSQYAPGAPVTFRVTLTSTADVPLWTDPPRPVFPRLVGSLSGPGMTRSMAVSPRDVPGPQPAPVYLPPGGSLEYTVILPALEQGVYTLAVAYGGNPASEWRGVVRAPLVRFRVGEAVDGDGEDSAESAMTELESRLRHVVEEILASDSAFRSQRSLQELERSGPEGVDMVVTVLREIANRPEEVERNEKGMGQLFSFLYNRRLTELLPFYLEMVKSPAEAVRSDAEVALRYHFRKAKDEAVRTQIREAVVAMYDDAAPGHKAYAMENYSMDAWPDLFEQMKVQAVEGDFIEQRQAVDVLCNYYLRKFDVFEGEFEAVLNLVLQADSGRVRHQAVLAIESFYGKQKDLPAVRRAIDRYRVAYPESFRQDAFFNRSDLWDMAWLERAAEEPTEARFTLVLASRAQLESHCGGVVTGFPDTWAQWEASAAAQTAYRETLQAWTACLREKPATFRVPVLRP